MIGYAGQHIGASGVRIDAVEPRGLDQREHDRRTLSATIGTGEQPCLAAKGNSAQRRSAALFPHSRRSSQRVTARHEKNTA